MMRFCQAMMCELSRHIGAHVDVPAGDIGVGKREVGYLFGQYKRLTTRFAGAITGKALEFGGSVVRTEATGYGVLYFVQKMLEAQDDTLEGKQLVISGAGNVSLHAAEKAIELGAKVIALSDSKGVVHVVKGMELEQLETAKRIKLEQRRGLDEFADQIGAEYRDGARPWDLECDIALPCATENELEDDDARTLVEDVVIGDFRRPIGAIQSLATLLYALVAIFASGCSSDPRSASLALYRAKRGSSIV